MTILITFKSADLLTGLEKNNIVTWMRTGAKQKDIDKAREYVKTDHPEDGQVHIFKTCRDVDAWHRGPQPGRANHGVPGG